LAVPRIAVRVHVAPLILVLTLVLLRNMGTAQITTTAITHHRVQVSDSSLELTQAEAAIQRHDFSTAETLLQKFVEANPENYQAWFDLGFVFHALGKSDESVAAYRKSVGANPNVFESNLNLGLTLAQSRNPEAEQFLRAATRLTPTAHVEEGQARAWRSLGHILAESKPDEALEAYLHASALQPADPEAHLSAGSILEKENRFAEAAKEYQQALTLDPLSKDALTGLANVYTRQRQFPEAESILRKLSSANPDDGGLRIATGRVLAAEKKNDEAIAEFEAGLKLLPSDNDARRDLGDLYLESAKYEEALNTYNSLLQQTPNDAELHDNAGKVLLKQHKFPQAQQEFMAAVKLKPDFGSAYGDLAVAANENKNYALAIQAADARAKFLPEIPVSYFLRATAYDHLRDIKRAALNYHQFLNVAKGQFPEQEWQARQRLIALEQRK